MSDKNGNNPNKVHITCPTCQTRFSTAAPTIEFSNSKYSSVITAAHEKLVRCISCGQQFLIFIADVNAAAITWGAGALTEKGVQEFEGTTVVKPNSGLIVPGMQ